MSTMIPPASDARVLASQLVGDGGVPNMFFVSTYADVYVVNEDNEGEFQTVDWLAEEHKKEYAITYGPFHSYSEAQKAYSKLDLDIHTGICLVVMEDRQTGTIKEKFLRKVVKVDYHFDETDNAKYFGYK